MFLLEDVGEAGSDGQTIFLSSLSVVSFYFAIVIYFDIIEKDRACNITFFSFVSQCFLIPATVFQNESQIM